MISRSFGQDHLNINIQENGNFVASKYSAPWKNNIYVTEEI